MTIAVSDDGERAWWDAARQASDAPAELRPLIAGDAWDVAVTSERARELRAWCASLAGWDPERAPLVFDALQGRPPSRRRSSGQRVNVRFSFDEFAAISGLSTARGLSSKAEFVRRCSLLEVRREAIHVREREDEIRSAETARVEGLAVGDLVYADAAHVTLRGRTARVIALRQENELWCLDLAESPLWLAAGTPILRRRR